MKLKEEIVRRIDRLMYRTWQEDEDSVRTWHSGFYHNYFEGFRENKVQKKRGKHTHVERAYAGTWYLVCGGRINLVLRKALYGLLIAGALGMYYESCFTDQIASNYSTIVSVVQAVVIFLFLWLIYLWAASALHGQKMTRSEYKTGHIRMMQVSAAEGVALAVTAAAKLAYAVFERAVDALHLLNAAALLVGAALLLGVYFLEARVQYDTETSECAEEDGFEIS